MKIIYLFFLIRNHFFGLSSFDVDDKFIDKSVFPFLYLGYHRGFVRTLFGLCSDLVRIKTTKVHINYEVHLFKTHLISKFDKTVVI
ncbi:hypothetical protein C5745_01065 [Sphingobacterium haloxyli]|uniref:Uncharacterized protein n=1 Tax=Sphingobacterium haloxyli TaxID=2100533 RepID=A0A2S9J910_9SPHI|nr:hypothetical protein C5745_01065 [Sphingobacterium haloxyli]